MPRRHVVRLLLGALALAGLLAMHGLAAHGTVAPAEAAPTATAAHHETDHGTTDDDASDHSGHGAAALCLALLVGVTLAALLRSGPTRGLLLRRTWQPVHWSPYHRTTDPPDLSSLCVLRC